jgi:hypothetical protein
MRSEIKNKLTKTYSTFSEYVNMAVEMPAVEWEGRLASNESGDESFYGDTNSFGEMVNRCYDGYNAKKISDKRHVIGDMMSLFKETAELSVCGESLDIPTFLSGDMKCFWKDVSDESQPRRVHLVYSGATPWYVESENYINHGGAVSVLADTLAENRYSVKVSAYYAVDKAVSGSYYGAMELKGYQEDVDVARIGAVTHASFWRRIVFAHLEKVGTYLGIKRNAQIDPTQSAYGYSKGISIISDEEEAEWLRISDDEIVIKMQSPESEHFATTESSANFVTESVQKIIENNNTNIIKL